MKLNLPIVSVVASLLGLITAFLSNIQAVAEKVGTSPQLIWFAVIGVVLSLALWKLLTRLKVSALPDTPHQPAHSIGLCILAATSAMFVLFALGWVVFTSVDRSSPYPPLFAQGAAAGSNAGTSADDSKAQSLMNLFEIYNASFFEQIDDAHNRPPTGATAELTIVTGPAGSGKSFLRRIISQKYPSAHIVKLCDKQFPSTHFCKECDGIKYVPKPELAYGQGTDESFNQMSAIQDLNKAGFFGSSAESVGEFR